MQVLKMGAAEYLWVSLVTVLRMVLWKGIRMNTISMLSVSDYDEYNQIIVT